MSVRIIVDSACDLGKEKATELGLDFISLKTIFGEKEYLDGDELSCQQFYEKLIESDELPSTSQATPYEFEKVFRSVVDNGDTGVCITLSSKLSGTNQSANIAAEDYEGKIFVVDSENVTLGEQILVMYAIRLRDEGRCAEEIADLLNIQKKNIRLIALLDTLEYLKKGGRISSAAAFAGTLLSIKPVVAVEDGVVSILGKARGSKNGSNFLNQQITNGNGINFDMPITLAYSGLSDELLRKYMADSAHLYDGAIDSLPICLVGSTIGTHVGPGAIAVSYFEKE